jgi:hypothetical protein
MKRNSMNVLFASLTLAVLVGCASEEQTENAENTGPDPAYLAASEPAGAIGVGEARTSVKDEENVVLVGRIGGSSKPFVEGLAAFTIVDPKVPHCPDDEGCPTPWDYCCVPPEEKSKVMATIQVSDDQGKPLKTSLTTGDRLKANQIVTLEGKVGPRVDDQVLVIHVTSIHVEDAKR